MLRKRISLNFSIAESMRSHRKQDKVHV